MAELFIKGFIVHLIVDFFLQPDWIADNKMNFSHPAAWMHGALNIAGNLLVFAPLIAIGLGITHILIDTRVPLVWWRRLLRQNPQGEDASTFYLLQDQAAHLIFLGVAVVLSGQ
ncbi:MAG: DUF3307 domain-containing protein [Anaerolineales bacterium]